MRGATGLDTQGERSISLPECLGTGPDRSFACKHYSCEFHSLNTVIQVQVPLKKVSIAGPPGAG